MKKSAQTGFGSVSESLLAFLAPDADRPDYIVRYLSSRGIPARFLELAGKRHVVVRFGTESYDPNFRTKLLVAHHDRAAGSPGANDNGAACFQLMQLAERIALAGGARWKGSLRRAHNTMILFTDGEEAAGTGGIRAQGSFAIGSGLKALGFDDADVYVFDACGRGDVLVLSTAGIPGRNAPRGNGFAKKSEGLRARARETARDAVPGKWITLLTPYSDNAGFMAASVVSQVITVLPQTEADTLLFALAGKGEGLAGPEDAPLLERLIAANALGSVQSGATPSGGTRGAAVRTAGERALALGRFIPETWRLMHGPADNASTLTSEAFAVMKDFLDCLAASLDPL